MGLGPQDWWVHLLPHFWASAVCCEQIFWKRLKSSLRVKISLYFPYISLYRSIIICSSGRNPLPSWLDDGFNAHQRPGWRNQSCKNWLARSENSRDYQEWRTIAFFLFVEFNQSRLRFHTYNLRSFAHVVNKKRTQSKMGVMIHDCIRGRVDVGEGLPSARPWKTQSLEVQGSATWLKKDVGKLAMVNEPHG